MRKKGFQKVSITTSLELDIYNWWQENKSTIRITTILNKLLKIMKELQVTTDNIEISIVDNDLEDLDDDLDELLSKME